MAEKSAVLAGAVVSETEAPRMYTEREMVLAKRQTWAWSQADAQNHNYHVTGPCSQCERARRGAAEQFPLLVTRPRVVRDPIMKDVEWKVEDGYLRARRGSGTWIKWVEWSARDSDFAPLAKRVAMWADLLANPTEQVEDVAR